MHPLSKTNHPRIDIRSASLLSYRIKHAYIDKDIHTDGQKKNNLWSTLRAYNLLRLRPNLTTGLSRSRSPSQPKQVNHFGFFFCRCGIISITDPFPCCSLAPTFSLLTKSSGILFKTTQMIIRKESINRIWCSEEL